jgi:hypothetical protein
MSWAHVILFVRAMVHIASTPHNTLKLVKDIAQISQVSLGMEVRKIHFCISSNHFHQSNTFQSVSVPITIIGTILKLLVATVSVENSL